MFVVSTMCPGCFGVLLSKVGVRGSPERDISSLRALGPEVGQISRVVRVSAHAPFGVLAEKCSC